MTQRETILDALRKAGPLGVTNGALNRLGIFRYSARIHELRASGYEIRTVNGTDGLAIFYLENEPSPQPVSSPPSSSNVDGGGEQAQLFEFPKPRPAHPLLDPEAA